MYKIYIAHDTRLIISSLFTPCLLKSIEQLGAIVAHNHTHILTDKIITLCFGFGEVGQQERFQYQIRNTNEKKNTKLGQAIANLHVIEVIYLDKRSDQVLICLSKCIECKPMINSTCFAILCNGFRYIGILIHLCSPRVLG